MLSGGLDTSSITCLSDRIIKENNLNIDLKTYSITFKDVKKKIFKVRMKQTLLMMLLIC